MQEHTIEAYLAEFGSALQDMGVKHPVRLLPLAARLCLPNCIAIPSVLRSSLKFREKVRPLEMTGIPANKLRQHRVDPVHHVRLLLACQP